MELMDNVLNEVKHQGLSDASVSLNYEQGFSVSVRMGEIETLAFSEQKGIDVTVYQAGRRGSASSSDTSPSAIRAMVKAAIDIADVSAVDSCFGLADAHLVASDYPDLDLSHAWDIEPATAIRMALECEARALGQDKRITNSDGVSVSTSQGYAGLATTQGFRGLVPSSRHTVSVSLVAAANEQMQRDYAYTTARHPDALRAWSEVANSAVSRTAQRLGARKIKTQVCPVIFSSRVSSGLFSTFVQAISGSNLYRKNSFLFGKLGQPVFPEWLRIYEQPHLLRGLGSVPFDEEGLLTRPNVIVEGGVLRQYVLNSYTARKLGLETTANSGGVCNLTVDASQGDLTDLLRVMQRGLLVTELMGQGVNVLTGDYSRGATGFWVEGGEIQYPVEEVTIAGNLRNMFLSIGAIGTDVDPNLSTRCGSVLMNQMTVAGDN